MQIVINISEDLYKATINGLLENELWDLRVAIKNGTPLPKNCRLIDVNALPNEVQGLYSIRSASVIIDRDDAE